MFAHSLPKAQKRDLLKIVRLLQVFEAPLLWEGKTADELTGNTNLGDIKFNISDALGQVWENATRLYGDKNDLDDPDSTGFVKGWLNDLDDPDSTGIVEGLLDRIRELRITLQNDMAERQTIATAVLKEQILEKSKNSLDGLLGRSFFSAIEENKENILPKDARIVLFEAMRLSFHGSGPTDPKRELLQIVSMAYGIDGESFNELFAQAIALNKEIKRSINLVLE